LNDEPDSRPSKTQQKARMHELQALGAALVDLPESAVAAIAIPDKLAAAVQEARRITSHEGRRRQLQYVGKLMRDVDPEPIRRALAERAGQSALARAQQLNLERWRARLIEDEGALTAFAESHPGADLQALRALIRNARKEIAETKPPRAQRELFRMIRELEARANAAPGDTGEEA
jgi:ribosome-associated protein